MHWLQTAKDRQIQGEDKTPQATVADLCSVDLLARLFMTLGLFRLHAIAVALTVFSAHGYSRFGSGFAIPELYARHGKSFLAITDPREFPMSVLLALVSSPPVCTFYIWQPRGILSLFRELSRNGVVHSPKGDTWLNSFVRR